MRNLKYLPFIVLCMACKSLAQNNETGETVVIQRFKNDDNKKYSLIKVTDKIGIESSDLTQPLSVTVDSTNKNVYITKLKIKEPVVIAIGNYMAKKYQKAPDSYKSLLDTTLINKISQECSERYFN